ncbi:hypothetical protein [Clostridium sp. HBUAS56010]|uniref:hypothetical protein n=1 Tax=Clostridium sp. HBUAS56010 TaxID=2571127 RepID=UPI0011788D49|nr:hypothetical protein [Clostridium sp. HBUAS56010]
MHPNKFFSEVSCRTDIEVFEIFDRDLKEKLKNIHPNNFLKTKITLPVYKLILDYDTESDNHKTVERYMVMDSPLEEEFSDCWADIYCRDYNSDHPNRQMKNLNIIDIVHICDAVLPIGR